MTDNSIIISMYPPSQLVHRMNSWLDRKSLSPDAQWMEVPSFVFKQGQEAVQSFVVHALQEHVKKHGMLKEVVLQGHGYPGGMFAMGSIQSFIEAINTPTKLTERVVFAGCDTLNLDMDMAANPTNTALIEYQVNGLVAQAKETRVEIVGTTTTLIQTPQGKAHARFVAFTPDGQIKRDKLDIQSPLTAQLPDKLSWEEAYIGAEPTAGLAQYRQQPGRGAKSEGFPAPLK